MLRTYTFYLHDGAGPPKFVPIVREELVEAMEAARQMLDADGSLVRVEIHAVDGAIVQMDRQRPQSK